MQDISIERMAEELTCHLRGWLGCSGKCVTASVLRGLEESVQRRLRHVPTPVGASDRARGVPLSIEHACQYRHQPDASLALPITMSSAQAVGGHDPMAGHVRTVRFRRVDAAKRRLVSYELHRDRVIGDTAR
ncbi:hypothetical protein [Bradyrhizobium pachyrhizi]|uniref:hypothetical protein n=1 Tax=Bradyrhizobium pachyrhizi TaxID=280333 RepID=UPI003D319F82